MAVDATLPAGYSLLGQALLATGDPDGALAAFLRELASNPNDYDANLRAGQILPHAGRSTRRDRAWKRRWSSVRRPPKRVTSSGPSSPPQVASTRRARPSSAW